MVYVLATTFGLMDLEFCVLATNYYSVAAIFPIFECAQNYFL